MMARPGWEAARRAQVRKAVAELAVLLFVVVVGIAWLIVGGVSQ